MSKDNSGPAFPVTGRWTDAESRSQPGMSLRDYFAAAALPAIVTAYVEANGRCIGTDHVRQNCPVIAYQFADAMLKERAK